jgi:hypothetical protein
MKKSRTYQQSLRALGSSRQDEDSSAKGRSKGERGSETDRHASTFYQTMGTRKKASGYAEEKKKTLRAFAMHTSVDSGSKYG